MPYCFEFDRVHRILQASIEDPFGDDEIAKFRSEMSRLVSDLQPHACVVDLSDIKQLEISSESIRAIGRATPALPGVSIPVILVAPAIHIFGASRMFQITSEEKRPWLRVVKSAKEAYESLNLDSPSFEPLPLDSEEPPD